MTLSAAQLPFVQNLEDDYDQAWAQWSVAGEEDVWEQTVEDGLRDAPR